jgi:AraC family transcriptional regulator
MDQRVATEADVYSEHTADSFDEERALQRSCAVMKIMYVERMAQSEPEQARDDIEVLIPGERTVFQVVWPAPDQRRQRILVREPQICIIPAGRKRALVCERQHGLMTITLDRAFFELNAREALGAHAPTLAEQCVVFDPFLRELSNSLRIDFQPHRLDGRAYLENLAAVIATHVATHHCGGQLSGCSYAGLPPHKLNRVRAFIEEHFTERVRLQQLAAIVHMSPYHFARMFKKSTGDPPHVYITAQRVQLAKALLEQSDLPLVDVAGKVGFQTQGHFTSVFRKYTGLTPRVYRLRVRAVANVDQCASSRAMGRATHASLEATKHGCAEASGQ